MKIQQPLAFMMGWQRKERDEGRPEEGKCQPREGALGWEGEKHREGEEVQHQRVSGE